MERPDYSGVSALYDKMSKLHDRINALEREKAAALGLQHGGAQIIKKLEAGLQSVARWATDEKLTAEERINIITNHPQVRAALKQD